MNNKLIKKSVLNNNQQEDITTVINVGNNEVVEIFGINNENIDYFQKLLSIKVFQKGNQLSLKGSRKNVNILRDAISKTLYEKKIYKAKNIHNQIIDLVNSI